MPTRQQQRIAELAAIAQLYRGLSEPQQQADEARQRNALGILGLVLRNQQENSQLAAQQEHYKNVLAASENQATAGVHREFLQGLMSDPNIPWSQKQAAIASIEPSLAPVGQAMDTAARTADIQRRAPEFSAIYEKNKNDIPKLNTALDALKLTMHPDTFAGQNWDALNAALPAPAVPTPPLPAKSVHTIDPYGPGPGIIELLKRAAKYFPAGAFGG